MLVGMVLLAGLGWLMPSTDVDEVVQLEELTPRVPRVRPPPELEVVEAVEA